MLLFLAFTSFSPAHLTPSSLTHVPVPFRCPLLLLPLAVCFFSCCSRRTVWSRACAAVAIVALSSVCSASLWETVLREKSAYFTLSVTWSASCFIFLKSVATDADSSSIVRRSTGASLVAANVSSELTLCCGWCCRSSVASIPRARRSKCTAVTRGNKCSSNGACSSSWPQVCISSACSIFSLCFPTPGSFRTLRDSRNVATCADAAAAAAGVPAAVIGAIIFWPLGLLISDAILATKRLGAAPALQLNLVAADTAARISDTSAVTLSSAAFATASSVSVDAEVSLIDDVAQAAAVVLSCCS